DYLSNLSIVEICLVINISSCIFILTCLITILFAIYGNILIDKLNLEEKYPKLASFIKLRVKLLHIYVFINTLLILIALVLMVIINFITLTNG
ncbi:LAGLIDADG endonuclease, partial (mitochondrion) [Drechmeria coniospora]